MNTIYDYQEKDFINIQQVSKWGHLVVVVEDLECFKSFETLKNYDVFVYLYEMDTQ